MEGLKIFVKAPDEAKVNEEFNVKLSIYSPSEIYVKSLTVSFGSSWSPIYEETLFYEQKIEKEFSKTYVLKTSDYGKLPCTITIYYVMWKDTPYERSYEETFELDLTYVTDKTREELENVYWNYTLLKSEYESLKTDYGALYENYSKLYWSYDSCSKYRNYLESEYKKLEENYNSLNEKLQEQYRNTDIFFLTTIIFLASTIYLEWKII
jgi:hypothetical protein